MSSAPRRPRSPEPRAPRSGPVGEAAPAGSGRRVAAKVLVRVAEEGAWASRALDAELGRARLPASEAGRASDLVYGTLRGLRSIDRAIDAQRKKPGAIEPLALAVLRASVFELLHTAAPSHAVVSEAVALVKRERGPGLAGFVNAVLRHVASARPPSPLPRTFELPDWARELASRSLSPERAAALAEAAGEAPPLGLRAYRTTAPDLAAALRAERPDAVIEESALSSHALLCRRLGDPRTLAAYAAGALAVQDVGSQRVAELVDAQPGETVLDACAGHGGKSAILAAAVGGSGRIVAADLHAPKLEAIGPELSRLGLRAALETHAIDLSVGVGRLRPGFDRALVDAPCTGLGTLRRRPEILLRLGPADVARMAALELAIVSRVVPLVRPGGLLVVATCSFAAAEGAGLADAIGRAFPSLERVEDAATDADGVARIGPWSEPGRGSDAYQVTRFRVPS